MQNQIYSFSHVQCICLSRLMFKFSDSCGTYPNTSKKGRLHDRFKEFQKFTKQSFSDHQFWTRLECTYCLHCTTAMHSCLSPFLRGLGLERCSLGVGLEWCNIVIINPMPMFIVLSSWQGHCESSVGSFDECRLSATRLPILRPSQLTWAVSLPIRCHHLHPVSPFIIITQPEG